MIDLLAGATAGIATNEAQRHIDKYIHQDRDNESLFQDLKTKMGGLHDDIRIIARHFQNVDEPPIDRIFILQVDPARVRLATLGRRYNMIFCPNNVTVITANMPGIGQMTFTPTIGWTELDFRDGTELFLASGTPQNIIFRITNVPLGANVL